MAIPQDRYVKIISTNVGDPAVTARDLNGLLFTKGKGWIGTEPMDPENIVECNSSDQVAKYFSTSSDEYKFAKRYFSYLSPSGTAPSRLSFARCKVTDASGKNLLWKKIPGSDPEAYGWFDSDGTQVTSPVVESAEDALIRINSGTNNFGSFAYIDGDFTCKQIKDVIAKNKAYNYKYIFAVSTIAGKTGVASDAAEIGSVATLSFADYLGEKSGMTGTVLVHGDSVLSSEMPMAIFSATNYNGINTATFQMFKQFADETATVMDADTADSYDEKNVNYMGLVQINGTSRSFYQRGKNINGENTAVYCNEIWLKSRISTEILDMMLSVEKIPANDDGEIMIENIVTSAAEVGITNGSIEKGKEFTTNQKAKIFQLTGDPDAWFVMQERGYYTMVEIKQDEKDLEYKAYYKLVYSKGDAISYVEGTDVLV